MKTCTTTRRATCAPAIDLLAELAAEIDLLFNDPINLTDPTDPTDPTVTTAPRAGQRPDPDRAHLVSIHRQGPTVTAEYLSLDSHPADALVGFRAPDRCWALGVVAPGTARSYDPASCKVASPAEDPGRRIRLVHLVGRDGDAVAVARIEADDPLIERHPGGSPDSYGHLDDSLRRALGLPTAPPPPSTLGLWASVWLEAILEAACGGGFPSAATDQWSALARYHPIFTMIPEIQGSTGVAVWAEQHLSRAGQHFARQLTWAALLARERSGIGLGAVPVGIARWMDVGMYARSLLIELPERAVMVADLHELLTPSVHTRLQNVLQSWDLDP